MIRNTAGARSPVIEFRIRMTVHKLRCVCLCVCLFVWVWWNWLDSTFPPPAWLSRPQLNGPSTDHRRSVSVLSEAYEKLSSISLCTVVLSLSPVVAPGPPLPTLLCLSLYSGHQRQENTRDRKRRKYWSMHCVLILKHYWIYFGCLRVFSGARPQVASALAPCMCYKYPLHFHPSLGGGIRIELRGGCWARGGPRGVATSYRWWRRRRRRRRRRWWWMSRPLGGVHV